MPPPCSVRRGQGTTVYTALCNEGGGVLADLTVSHIESAVAGEDR